MASASRNALLNAFSRFSVALLFLFVVSGEIATAADVRPPGVVLHQPEPIRKPSETTDWISLAKDWQRGIGSFVGASITGLAIVFAAWLGFRGTMRVQRQAAANSRDIQRRANAGLINTARHNARLTRERDAQRRMDESVALASALRAELENGYTTYLATIVVLSDEANIERWKRARAEAKHDAAVLWPETDVTIYCANADKIGLLGPNLAGRVVSSFGTLIDVNRHARGDDVLVSVVLAKGPDNIKLLKRQTEKFEATLGELRNFINEQAAD